MSRATVTCPYCGAYLPDPPPSVTQRLTCPRCGESFPYRPSTDITTSPEAPLPAAPPSPAADQYLGNIVADPVGRWSRRGVLLSVLGVMAGMALLSLAFALSTVASRRKNDPKPLPTPMAQAPALPPVEWAALSYLPDRIDLVIGVQVAAARQTPAGRAFLTRAELGNLGFTLTDLESAIGLKLADLDHVVLGVRIEDLRTVLVVRTLRPYDAAGVRTALKASHRGDSGKRDVYQFTLEKQRLSAVLWSPDEYTLVVGLNAKDVAAIPSPPAADRLPTVLADLLRKHTSAQDVLWMVGRFEKTEALRDLLAARFGDDERTALAALRSFVFGLELGGKVALAMAVDCADEEGTAAVEKSLDKLKANDGAKLKVLGPGPDGERVARELADSFRMERKGTTLQVKAVANAEALRQAEK